MNEILVKTIDLKNSIKLKIYDGSKKIASDRWRVSLIVRLEIPIDKLSFNNGNRSNASIDEIKEVLGEKVLFEQKSERSFVDDIEKEDTFKILFDSFLSSSLSYFSHSDFPKRLVLRKYKETMDKKALYTQFPKSMA